MLVLFETPAGYALFKLLDDGKLSSPDDIYKDFETTELATKTYGWFYLLYLFIYSYWIELNWIELNWIKWMGLLFNWNGGDLYTN